MDTHARARRERNTVRLRVASSTSLRALPRLPHSLSMCRPLHANDAIGQRAAALFCCSVLAAVTVGGADSAPTTRDTCSDALQSACGAQCHPHSPTCTFRCAACAGQHQQQLSAAGCDNNGITAWCAGVAPPPPPGLHLNPMQRVLLRESKAIDGSPALYYLGRNASSTKYVIWLEGGGICQSLADCQNRAKGSLGSSRRSLPVQNVGQGMMLADRAANPDFYEWNRVYVPYVSGDVWGGAAPQPLNPFLDKGDGSKELMPTGTVGFFQGHLIVEEVLSSLKQASGLADATEVILTGCSAGGIGAITNCDYVADTLTAFRKADRGDAAVGPRVSCRPEAGWFGLPINDYAHFSAGTVMADLRHLRSSNWTYHINPWTPRSPEGQSCAADVAAGKKSVSNCNGQLHGPVDCCGVPTVLFDYVRTPIYISENTADQYQVQAQGGMPSVTGPEEARYIDYLRGILAGSLTTQVVNGARKSQNGLFAPACFKHCMDWNSGPTVGGRNHAQAFGDWYFKRGRSPAMSLNNDTDAANIVQCKND